MAEKGDPRSMCEWAELNQQDPKFAFKLYEKAAATGFLDATFSLARCYRAGEGVRQDTNKAFELFKKAAEQGHLESSYNLAYSYIHGEGVKKNETKAVEWYTKAIAKPHRYLIPALNNLGRCYNHGMGTPQNLQKALLYYTQAAEMGDLLATHNVGACNFQGNGMEPNYPEAVKWFKRSGARGLGESNFLLAQCYMEGKGMKVNQSKAAYYILRAAWSGHETASKIFISCGEKNFKGVSVVLGGEVSGLILFGRKGHATPEQITELETKVKGKLPNDYKQFLRKYNGGYTNFTGILKDNKLYNGVEHYFSVEEVLSLYPFEYVSSNAIPIGEDAGNNVHYMYIKGPKKGKVYFFDAETTSQASPKKDEFPPIADTFYEFIDSVYCNDPITIQVMNGYQRSKMEKEQQRRAGVKVEDDEDSDDDSNDEEYDDEDGEDDEGDEDEEEEEEKEENDKEENAEEEKEKAGENNNNDVIESKSGKWKIEYIPINEEDNEEDGQLTEEQRQEKEKARQEVREKVAELEAIREEKKEIMPTLPYLGFISEKRYLRMKDYNMADFVTSFVNDAPCGPRLRHKQKLMWDHGIYTKKAKQGNVAKTNYFMVNKELGSVVHGGMPRAGGVSLFDVMISKGEIQNDMSNYVSKD